MDLLMRLGRRARGLSLAVLVVLCAACSPEIGTGTYFCGPEGLCPPELACNPSSFSCESPGSFGEFTCPEGSQDAEPDDALATAGTLGTLGCNYTGPPILGCLPEGDEVDLVAFEYSAACGGSDPHLEIELSFPIASAPVMLELVDAQGEVVAIGAPCTPEPNYTGMDRLCLPELDPPAGIYAVRLRLVGSGLDCDGACRFNQYLLFVRYPVA